MEYNGETEGYYILEDKGHSKTKNISFALLQGCLAVLCVCKVIERLLL